MYLTPMLVELSFKTRSKGNNSRLEAEVVVERIIVRMKLNISMHLS
jgi:hypothetical protein